MFSCNTEVTDICKLKPRRKGNIINPFHKDIDRSRNKNSLEGVKTLNGLKMMEDLMITRRLKKWVAFSNLAFDIEEVGSSSKLADLIWFLNVMRWHDYIELDMVAESFNMRWDTYNQSHPYEPVRFIQPRSPRPRRRWRAGMGAWLSLLGASQWSSISGW